MEFLDLFRKDIENDSEYLLALEVVQRNSRGKVWLVGGSVFKRLNNIVNGTSVKSPDFDFIVEECKEDIILPEGWTKEINHFGNPKLKGEGIVIDFIPIEKFHPKAIDKENPSIDSYLNNVPLSVHSIAYDSQEKKILGEKGLRSILDKKFYILNQEGMEIMAERKGKSVSQIIEGIADVLGWEFLGG